MTRPRGCLLLMISWLLAGTDPVVAQASRPPVSSPSVIAPPTWWRAVQMPDGAVLNGNYIAFLRSALPGGRARLRTKGKTEPVVVVTDGRTVAVMMPIQPAR